MVLFGMGFLVDADTVGPHTLRFVFICKMFQGNKKALGYEYVFLVAKNGFVLALSPHAYDKAS
jgi:hypothetical protein